jgi:hypothetical protein
VRALGTTLHAAGWLVVAAAAAPQALSAQAGSPQALTGLRTVTVLLERTSPETIAAGIDTAALRSRAEAAVSRLGIQLLPAGARDSAAGVLYVNAFAATNAVRDWYAAHVEVEVMQPVTIDRTPDARLFATTWQAPVRLRVVRAAELPGEVTQAVDAMLAEFAQAWTAANPAPAR